MMTKESEDITLSLIQSQLDQLADMLPDLQDAEHSAGQVFSDILQGFERLSENINQQNSLIETRATISSALTERQIFDALFEQIRFQNPNEIHAFRFKVVNDEPLWAESKADWQESNNPSYPPGSRLYLPESLLAGLLTTNKPLFLDDIASDKRLTESERESFSLTGARSVAILPLSARGQALGVILVSFNSPHNFPPATKRLWLNLVDQVNINLANQQLIQEAAYHVSQIEIAAEIARTASSILDFQELLDSAVALIRDRFQLYYVGVFLVDKVKEWAVLRAGTGKAGRIQLEKNHRLKIGGGSMIGWSIYNRQPRIALDVGKEAVHFQNPDLPDTRSEMALPLIYRNEVIGALTIQSVEQAAFNREDIILLQTMADQLANAIQNARLFRQAQEELAERERAETALQTSEAKYRELVQYANSIIIRFDTKGCITFFNEFAQSFFGYAEEEIIGQNVVGTIVPETDTAGHNLATMIEGIIQFPDQYTNNENENMRRDGERVWIAWTNKAIFNADEHISEILCVGNDITERKQTEEALRNSEALYSSLVENLPQNIFRKDLEGRFTFANERFCTTAGNSLEQLIGRTDYDFYPRELAEKYRRDDLRVIETEQILELVEEHQPPGGDKIYVRVVKTPTYDIRGQVNGIQGIFWDITERKRAEEALRKSEEQFRLIFERSPIGIATASLDGEFLQINQAYCDMVGYTADEMLGKPFAKITHPDDLGANLALKQKTLQGEIPHYQLEKRYIHKNGQTVHVILQATLVHDSDGNPLHFIVQILDITKRKQIERDLAEERNLLRALIDNLPDYIYVKNLESRFLLANDATKRHLGAKSDDEIVGRTDFDFSRPDMAQQFFSDERQLFETAQPLIGHEESIFDYETGTTRWVSITKVPFRDSRGEIAGLVGLNRDITELKQTQEALQEAFRRTQLLYNISEALATLADQQTALETVLGEYLLLLDLDRGGIMLFDQASEFNRVQALYVDNKIVEPKLAIPVSKDLIAKHLIKHKTSLVIDSVSTHPLTKHNEGIRGRVESMLLIPLIMKGEVIGILGADAVEKGHTFTQDDIEIGEAIADQLTIWLENWQLLEEAQHRSNLLQTAAEVSKAASSILDVDQLINTSVNYIRDQFDFYYVGIFLVDEAQDWAVLRAGTGEAGRIQLEKGHRLKIGGESMIGWSVKHRQARIALDVGEEAVRFQNPDLPDTHSEMALPHISRDEVIGAITVQSTIRGAFSNEDITVLQTMADQLANAIANARLFENELRSRKTAEVLLQETRALQQFSQALAGTLEISKILDLFFQVCTEEIGFEYVQFSLVDKYRHRVEAIAGIGLPQSQIKRSNRSLDSDDIMIDIIRTGQTEIITGWDDRFDKETYEAEGHADWVRVFTPIVLRKENIGLVEAGFNKNTRSSIQDSQLRLLRAFIDQVALAVDNAQRYEASQRTARREALIKDITTKVRASTDLNTILQTAVKEVGDAVGSKKAYIHLVSPENSETE